MGGSVKQEAKLLPLESVLKLVASAEALTTEERSLFGYLAGHDKFLSGEALI